MPYKVQLKTGAILEGIPNSGSSPAGIFSVLLHYKEQVAEAWWDCEGRARGCGGLPALGFTGNQPCQTRHPLPEDVKQEWDALIANNYVPVNRRSYY